MQTTFLKVELESVKYVFLFKCFESNPNIHHILSYIHLFTFYFIFLSF